MECSTPSPVCQDPSIFWDLQLAGTKETHIVNEVSLESPPSSDGAYIGAWPHFEPVTRLEEMPVKS